MIDLHTHSDVSDGSDPPEQIPVLAAAAGCRAVALTDHDRLDGIAAARASAQLHGIELVPGCELSCATEAGTMHVLVYFLEPEPGPLQDELAHLQAVRDVRNRAMCQRLGLSYDDLLTEAGGSGAGRPHAAALLVREGRAGSVQDAFDRWLAKGRPGYVEKERLEPAAALRLARDSGGVAVLAHPLSLDLDPAALEAAVAELRDLGLAGMECEYGRYTLAQRDHLTKLAGALDLVASGGSDYHGTYKPDLAIGVGRGDLDVSDEVLDALAARRL
ncbi:MAG: PHP domain-containing protein [Actinobacteria bacterium]|nr:PHP domain-containing protein [Actinomycetota bacterium]MBW3649725.1 PHP domain-containing protein [Actinomycetota bacterium]